MSVPSASITATTERPSSRTPSHAPSVTDQPTTARLPTTLNSEFEKHGPVQTSQLRAST
jgi:hypothetical protein